MENTNSTNVKSGGGCGRASVIIILVILFCCTISVVATGFGGWLLFQEIEKQDQLEEQQHQERKDNPKQVGDKLETESIEWELVSGDEVGQIISLEDEYSYSYECDAGEGNRFVLVELTAKNRTNEPFEYFDDTIPVIIDNNDNVYHNGTVGLYGCIEEDYDDYYYDLNPGIEKKIYLSYQVPDNAEGLLLRFDLNDDMEFSEEYDYFKID